MISIVSLIYKSTVFADSIYKSIMKYTPMVHDGRAEFFFIANDASDKVISYLERNGYKFYINNNVHYTEEELCRRGIAWPEYINRVYCGWNEAIRRSGEIVVLVNSDNLFSPNWLENLYKWLTKNVIVCSQLVERWHPKYGVFPGAYHGEYGNHPSNFKENEFIEFCQKVSKPIIRYGGAYMPCMFHKENALKVGLYPEGNLCRGKNFYDIAVYGDEEFFRRLSNIGVYHITALDSLVYHFKEGEMEE